MKTSALLILIVFFSLVIVGFAGATEGDESPTFSLHLVILDSFAPIGIGGEYFLGPVGLTGQVTFLPISIDNNFIVFLEPGFGSRFYFRKSTDNSFYTGASLHYMAIFGTLEDMKFNDDYMKVNAFFGFNTLIGRQNSARLAFELGYRFNFGFSGGATSSFVHFQAMIGQVW